MMRKRVLIAEPSEITRLAAETVLRQNGFEVIAVSSGEKAFQVLEHSKPHFIIVNCSLSGKGKAGIISDLKADPAFFGIPVIVLADENESGYSDEIKLNLPLDPNDLLSKINNMADNSKKPKNQEENPINDSLEDELLDQALGLDQIDVTDSEVMNQTETTKVGKKKKKVVEKMIGIDHVEDVEDVGDESSQIGSIRMDATSGEIKKSGKPTPSKTGKLEILSDHGESIGTLVS